MRWLTFVVGAGTFGSMLERLSPSYDGDGRQRGWHDKFADTVVIRKRQ